MMRFIILHLIFFSTNSLFAQSTSIWKFNITDSLDVVEKKYYNKLKNPEVSRGKLLGKAWSTFHNRVKGKPNESTYMKGKLQEMLNHNMHDYLDFAMNGSYGRTDFMMKQLEPGQLDVIRELYTKKLFNKSNVPSNLPANGEGWLAYKKRVKNATFSSKSKKTTPSYYKTVPPIAKKVTPKKTKRFTCNACEGKGEIKRRVWVIRKRERRAGNMGYGKSVVVKTTYMEYLRGAPKPSVGGNTTAKVEDVMLTCPKCNGKTYYYK